MKRCDLPLQQSRQYVDGNLHYSTGAVNPFWPCTYLRRGLCPTEIVQLAGQGRASLLRWIAAAHVVQHAFRVWRFRQGLIAGRHVRSSLQAATTQLQALWRARQPFRSYQALRHAAIRTQVIHIAVLVKLQSLLTDQLAWLDCRCITGWQVF